MRYTQCAVPTDFANNSIFTLRSHEINRRNVLEQWEVSEFEEKGTLNFTTKVKDREPGYDTVGFSFYKDYTVYDKTTHNVKYGLHRLFGARKADVALDDQLRQNQRHTRRGPLMKYIDTMVEMFEDSFLDTPPDAVHETSVKELADMPHVKRALRQRAYRKLVERGMLLDDLYMSKVKAKLKCLEKAKPGKKPRIIGDYSTEGSLLGGYLISRFKKAFKNNILDHKDDQIVFCDSPDVSVLSKVFKDHLNAKKFRCTYYSDDSIFSIRTTDGVLRHYCVDISSCDISNGPPIFDLLLELTKGDKVAHNLVRRLVRQCEQPLQVSHPHNPRERFKLTTKRNWPVEYSGSLITTVLNNIATSLIALSVYAHVKDGVAKTDVDSTIKKAAAAVGYIVTVGERDDFESLQFLKNSPTSTGDSYVNLGVLLRGLGSCRGDFPGSGPIHERVETFAQSVVAGYAHAGDNLITRALRRRFAGITRVKLPTGTENYMLSNLTGQENVVPATDLAKRYGCSVSDLQQLESLILSLKVGDVINCRALDKIFNVDYEYPSQSLE